MLWSHKIIPPVIKEVSNPWDCRCGCPLLAKITTIASWQVTWRGAERRSLLHLEYRWASFAVLYWWNSGVMESKFNYSKNRTTCNRSSRRLIRHSSTANVERSCIFTTASAFFVLPRSGMLICTLQCTVCTLKELPKQMAGIFSLACASSLW